MVAEAAAAQATQDAAGTQRILFPRPPPGPIYNIRAPRDEMKVCTPWEGACALAALLGAMVCAGGVLELSLTLYTAHEAALQRLDSEAWMLKNCRDPVFSSQLRAHTDVCSQVEASARLGAWGAAWRDVSDSAQSALAACASWLPVALTALAGLLLPGLAGLRWTEGGGHDPA